jgi:hypothetical protein
MLVDNAYLDVNAHFIFTVPISTHFKVSFHHFDSNCALLTGLFKPTIAMLTNYNFIFYLFIF